MVLADVRPLFGMPPLSGTEKPVQEGLSCRRSDTRTKSPVTRQYTALCHRALCIGESSGAEAFDEIMG